MGATANQVRMFRGMFAKAGLPLSSSRLRRFKSMTVTEASAAITAAVEEIAVCAVAAYAAPEGMATAAQLAYFSKMRRRLGSPVTDEEIESCKDLTTAAMQQLLSETMQQLQDQNDAHGVPLPAWRLERGLYDSEVLRAGHRAAAERQAQRRAELDAQIAHRQQLREQRHPRRRAAVAYPGEGGHP